MNEKRKSNELIILHLLEYNKFKNMKTIAALLIAAVAAEPFLHPDTGLAITTTGYHWYGQEPLAIAQTEAKTEEPFLHPDTGLAITTTGYHWYGQEPLALVQTDAEEPFIHPDTGLAITTTGYHWYGQEPLALAQKKSVQQGVRFINQPVE